ncbi:MAG TPA: TIM44-like domain-containing protein [Pseudolabrys sp.]|jgi:predicted lipid-binding transport protein (Tim44 family)|nr:TIM44-like domain-containing protein [Pseudolabrys sp.]
MVRHRWLIALAAIATALVLVSGDAANARAGGGFSGGSRGMRTFSTPAPTRTAPSAAPIQRSITQPNRTAPLGANTAARPGLFGGGLLGGLAAGFIGAGLFGLLFGHGFFGGMGGFASLIGLVLQIVLVVFVAKMLFAWWQRRNAPAYAGAGAAGAPGGSGFGFSSLGGAFGGGAATSEPVNIEKADYDAFERLLGEVQTAYSAEDLNGLRARVTPEMLSYFSEQMSQNASRGVINKVSGVHLEQGDLSEAWREGDSEYATVAMRFGLTDSMVDRASGRVVEGGHPEEVTELWTFVRARGGAWILSAIQQG